MGNHQQRSLDFSSLKAVVKDADQCVHEDAITIGNWSMGQVFECLARIMDGSVDGFSTSAPWLKRTVARLFMKKYALRRGLPAGFNLSGSLLAEILADPLDARIGFAHLKSAVARFESTSLVAQHPFLGVLTWIEWERLHRHHANCHLSFILPLASDSGEGH